MQQWRDETGFTMPPLGLCKGKSVLDPADRCAYTLPMRRTRQALLTKKVYDVVDTVIGQIEHLPHGHTWWYGMLPGKGKMSRHIVRQQWAHLIVATLFPPSFITMLLAASILPNGKPNGLLYTWILDHIYAGDITAMYADWFALNKGV
jgi:hypothetical protein